MLLMVVIWVCMYVCGFVLVRMYGIYTHVFSNMSASHSHRGQRMPLGVLLDHSLASFLRNSFLLMNIQCAWQQQTQESSDLHS